MKFDRRRMRRYRLRASLDLTPLVDVVLQLILFFMLSSSFVLQPGINIELPKSKAAAPQDKKDLVITIAPDNAIFLNSKQVAIDELEGALRRVAKDYPTGEVLIKPDTHVQTGKLVEVMGICVNAEFEKFGIATKPSAD